MAKFSCEGVKIFIDDIVYDIAETEDGAKQVVYMLNNCEHLDIDQIDITLMDGEIYLQCNICTAVASFHIPANLEWTR